MRSRPSLASLALVALLAIPLLTHATELSHFVPQGEAKRVRQVKVNFSEAIRPLGDLAAPDPVVWSCQGAPLKGNGRWVDTQSWALDFERELPAGVRCEFKPAAGLRDAAGKPVKMATIYRFDTGGPNIAAIQSNRYYGDIDEDAVFLVTATGPIDFATVESHSWCAIEGLGEKVPTKLLPAGDKKALLSRNGAQPRPEDLERTAALRCARQLPNGMKVRLFWGAGIKGGTGLPTTQTESKEFKVRPEFAVTVSCERENAKADCVPMTPIVLRFTASVRRDDVTKLRLLGPGGRKWSATVADDDGEAEFVDYVQFIGPFPAEAQFSLQVPERIRDDAGRTLTNRDRLAKVELKTAAYPPLVKFAADFGIVERKAGGLLPATLRNLEPVAERTDGAPPTADGSKPGTAATVRLLRLTRDEDILEWLRRANESRGYDDRRVSLLKDAAKTRTALLPKPHGPKPMEVVGIPLGEPGQYVVEAESKQLGEHLLDPPTPMYVRTLALNTNLAVHFKKGDENSLIWVTTLDAGQPVDKARVSLRTCDGKQVAFGTTGADGTLAIRRRLPEQPRGCKGFWSYFVSARADVDGVEDIGFATSEWQKGIERWRFKLPYPSALPDVMTHTIFDRPLFRTGETVHMKHLARRHTTAGFAYARREALPERIAIQLEGSDIRYELPLAWKNGGAESTWTIPPEAKLGRYWISFLRSGDKAGRVHAGEGDSYDGEDAWIDPGRYWSGGSFKVGEFRLPVMRGEVAGATAPVVATKELAVDLRLGYLAGGAAAGEKVRVRSEMRLATLKLPDGLENYTFGSPPLDPARIKAGDGHGGFPDPIVFDDQRDVALDKTGTRRVTIPELPQWPVPATVFTEMEYSDPSGEVHAAAGGSAWFPSAVLIGMASESWASNSDKVSLKLAALDTAMRPAAGVAYTVHGWYKRSFVHRKRLVGGFYSYDTRYDTVELGELCRGSSDGNGMATCEFKPPKDEKQQRGGELILEARAADSGGRPSHAVTSVWLGNNEEVWFEQDNDDRIDVLPEKKRYEPGDTALLQVRMPFREATALVSIEREGIIDRFVMPISGRDPTVRVPIKAHYGPNAYISVFVVRGRVGDVQPTALVDLGKPAYKLGIAEIAVGQKGYELAVKVDADKPVYKTREEVVARVRVTRPDGTPAKGGEFALAAVDEALLELARNDSWQLLTRMMARRGLGVETATAQAQVIGKRHFGLKALPAGGGGGRQPTRELFDTLIKWEARVVLDDHGEATVKLPLNDALTTIRIVAVAHQGTGLFGTGFTRIRSSKDVQLFAGLPPLVREGDQLRAGFTVRNLTQDRDSFTVTPTASALVEGKRLPLAALGAQTVTLEPGEARELGWPLSVPLAANRLDWQVSARTERGAGQDSIRVVQNVMTALPVRVQAATLEQVNGSLTVPVKLPAGAEPNRGSVDVFLKPKLGASSDGVKAYMESYPYACLEQKVSKALGTGSQARWEDIAVRLPTYLDADGLAAYFTNPERGKGSVALTAYLLAVSHEGGYAIPDAPRQRMLDALAAFVEGRLKDDAKGYWSPRPDLPIRKLMAIEALSRYGRATPQQLATVPITPGLWPTGALVDWFNIVTRLASLANRDKHLAEAEAILKTRMVGSGTLTQFANEASDYWWWLMVSPDATAARAISALMDRPAWQREIPRLVRGVMARQQEGRWNTTPANVWGVLMLDKFARKFESEPVTGETRVSLAGSATPAQATDWSKLPASETGKAQAVATGKAPVQEPGSAWREPGERLRFAWPATGAGSVSIEQQGNGKPWATIQVRAARALATPLYAGFEVKKTTTAIEQKVKGRWSQGDVVQVRLEVKAPTTWTWVVVNDPVPAGATILGSGLGRESQLAATGGQEQSGSWASFIERAFDGYRAYYETFGGKNIVEYRYRLNNSGRFQLPPTRVEAMYAPENFGEVPNETVHVD